MKHRKFQIVTSKTTNLLKAVSYAENEGASLLTAWQPCRSCWRGTSRSSTWGMWKGSRLRQCGCASFVTDETTHTNTHVCVSVCVSRAPSECMRAPSDSNKRHSPDLLAHHHGAVGLQVHEQRLSLRASALDLDLIVDGEGCLEPFANLCVHVWVCMYVCTYVWSCMKCKCL